METLQALLELGALERLPRTGWLLAGLARPESVAAHSLGTALVVLALGPRVEGPEPLDVDRAVALAVVHDAPEAILTDLPRQAAALLPQGAKRAAEDLAAERLFGAELATAWARWDEYRDAATREARFVRVCDKLHLGVQLLAYRRAGAAGLDDFRASLASLDAGEFPVCERLRDEILAALDELP